MPSSSFQPHTVIDKAQATPVPPDFPSVSLGFLGAFKTAKQMIKIKKPLLGSVLLALAPGCPAPLLVSAVGTRATQGQLFLR